MVFTAVLGKYQVTLNKATKLIEKKKRLQHPSHIVFHQKSSSTLRSMTFSENSLFLFVLSFLLIFETKPEPKNWTMETQLHFILTCATPSWYWRLLVLSDWFVASAFCSFSKNWKFKQTRRMIFCNTTQTRNCNAPSDQLQHKCSKMECKRSRPALLISRINRGFCCNDHFNKLS